MLNTKIREEIVQAFRSILDEDLTDRQVEMAPISGFDCTYESVLVVTFLLEVQSILEKNGLDADIFDAFFRVAGNDYAISDLFSLLDRDQAGRQ